MNSKARPFLDFYEKHSVIPTTLEVTDQEKFFKQRDFLFETLGIPKHFLRGSKFLELGPGTGQKAVHLLSLDPTLYVAVDNNYASINATRKVIGESGFIGTAKVVDSDFLDFADTEKYDLVIAELVVPTQDDPLLFLNKLSTFLVPGGVLIFTCMDPISLLSETLRSAIVKSLQLIDNNVQRSAARIVAFFEQDLNLLHGMNRKRTDWAIDQMIKPPVGALLDFPSALYSLANVAVFHGSSPRFTEDLRWYKSPEISEVSSSMVAIENYWRKCHNFLDFRTHYPEATPRDNQLLFQLCEDVYSAVYEGKWGQDSREIVDSRCREILKLISENCLLTSASLESFLSYWQAGETEKLQDFRPWWGRGTQYVSVIKSV